MIQDFDELGLLEIMMCTENFLNFRWRNIIWFPQQWANVWTISRVLFGIESLTENLFREEAPVFIIATVSLKPISADFLGLFWIKFVFAATSQLLLWRLINITRRIEVGIIHLYRVFRIETHVCKTVYRLLVIDYAIFKFKRCSSSFGCWILRVIRIIASLLHLVLVMQELIAEAAIILTIHYYLFLK